MYVQSASSAVPQSLIGRRLALPGHALPRRVALAVDSIGGLVPRTAFTGRVHSVFAQACNVMCHDTLLTLCASDLGDGPTLLRLARGVPRDLRALFDVGEPVHCRQGRVRTARTELLLTHARVWSPAPLREFLPAARIQANLLLASRCLAHRRSTHPSVIDGAACGVVAALRDACRDLDPERVVLCVDRLIGWGEGLTPAGDDFLIGLIAGLGARVQGQQRRHELLGAISAALGRATHRTTPIAAHYLHLAAHGHYTQALVQLLDALLCEDRAPLVDAALHKALAIGATSGADTVCGMSSALQAWLPAPSIGKTM